SGRTRIVVSGGFVNYPALSRDGKRLAYVSWKRGLSGSAICAVSLDLQYPIPSCFGKPGLSNSSPVWASDGKRVLFVSTGDVYEQQVWLEAQPVGDITRLTTQFEVRSLSLSADGTRAAYLVDHAKSQVWSAPISSGRATPASEIRPLTKALEGFGGFDVSPNG